MAGQYPVDPLQLDSMISELTNLLSDARDFTASGRPITNPTTSRAFMPRVVLEKVPAGGAAFGSVQPQWMYDASKGVVEMPTVSQVQKELGKARIDKLLGSIDLNLPKDLPPLPEGMSNWDRFKQAARMPVGLMTFIDLMTHSPELNTGEQQELATRRSMPPTVDR